MNGRRVADDTRPKKGAVDCILGARAGFGTRPVPANRVACVQLTRPKLCLSEIGSSVWSAVTGTTGAATDVGPATCSASIARPAFIRRACRRLERHAAAAGREGHELAAERQVIAGEPVTFWAPGCELELVVVSWLPQLDGRDAQLAAARCGSGGSGGEPPPTEE
ncbi:MAG: hypothetical protein B7733_03565 [Myxococcales bacterium FL481]|nr:MAG: hypothetical protein B7733_03565 [Myxococcales bacterium FL481]